MATKMYQVVGNLDANRIPPDVEGSDIIDCLCDHGAASIPTIAKETGLPEEDVKSVLAQLMKQGVVIKRNANILEDYTFMKVD